MQWYDSFTFKQPKLNFLAGRNFGLKVGLPIQEEKYMEMGGVSPLHPTSDTGASWAPLVGSGAESQPTMVLV